VAWAALWLVCWFWFDVVEIVPSNLVEPIPYCALASLLKVAVVPSTFVMLMVNGSA